MEKKREFLTLMVILLFAAGIFFHEGKAIFAGFSITLLILTDLFVFHIKMKKTASLFQSIGIADNTIIFRGKSIGITTESEVTVLPGTTVQIDDMIPKGSVVTSGSTISPVLTTSGNYTRTYDILCLSHGMNRFEGIKLNISDMFFSECLVVRKPGLNQPEIMVFPRPSFTSGSANPGHGKSTNKRTFQKGDQMKGLREYNVYDDIRKIDWKASAKYDKLLIKEFTGIEKDMQMIFIDLPDREDPASEEKSELIKGVAASLLMNEDKNKSVNIVGISGPNITAVIKSKNTPSEVFDLMNRIRPAAREKHLYKYQPKSYGYDRTRLPDFTAAVSEKTDQYFSFQSPHVFEKQAYNVLGNLSAGREVYIITLPDSDLSHLKILAQIARHKELRSVCFIPHDEHKKSVLSHINSCGFDEVNPI